jgi:hypothetical protein
MFKPPLSWLRSWWFPDPRKAPRKRVPGLAAYYWTGASPLAHTVKDISSTGLYIVTEDRWYPGTLVLMALQENNNEESGAGHSIAVCSRVIRWGTDGVGLQFVPYDSPAARDEESSQMNGMDQKQLDQFLQRLLRTKD